MLNNNDVQLFYKLLDSLSTSLRDLVVKYELLLREAGDREKVATAMGSLSKEMVTTFATMSQDIKSLREMAASAEEKSGLAVEFAQASAKVIEGLDSKATQILRELGLMSPGIGEAVTSARHIDAHMDDTSSKISELIGISQKMTAMILAVEEMKKEFAPIKQLSLMMSKPVAIILGVYFVVATVLAVMKGCDEYKGEFARPKPVATNHVHAATNYVGSATNGQSNVP